jgi:hypothetical protein
MRDDRALRAIRTQHGAEGYGVALMLLECVCESPGVMLKWTPAEAELLAGDFGVDTDRLTAIVNRLTALRYLTRDGDYLTADCLRESAENVFSRRTVTLDTIRAAERAQHTTGHDTTGHDTTHTTVQDTTVHDTIGNPVSVSSNLVSVNKNPKPLPFEGKSLEEKKRLSLEAVGRR